MRARFLGVLAVAAAIGMAACSGPKVKEFGKADQDAIRKLVQDFVAAYNAHDLEKVGACFSGNGSIMPANRSTLRGVDLVKTFFEERFANGASNLQIDVHDLSGSGTLAYVTGTFSFDMSSPGGGVPIRDRGKVVWILRNLGGQWKFEVQIMSSDLPPVLPVPIIVPEPEKK